MSTDTSTSHFLNLRLTHIPLLKLCLSPALPLGKFPCAQNPDMLESYLTASAAAVYEPEEEGLQVCCVGVAGSGQMWRSLRVQEEAAQLVSGQGQVTQQPCNGLIWQLLPNAEGA